MTCCVGLVEDGVVYLGADSAGVGGNLALTVRADQKVFRNGPYLMAFTTSFRMGQLLRHAFVPPDHDPRVPVDRHLSTKFIDAVRDCLKGGGYARKNNEQEEGGTFLVGYGGKLFTVYDDYQVSEAADEFAAVGCGEAIALGALYATRSRPPQERVRVALEAAERFSAGVRGPFTIIRGGD